jgi:O-antigen/teichoic acid export membrane protein
MTLKTMRKSNAALASVAATFASPALGLATAPILARGLGVGERGELAALVSLFTVGTVIASCAVPEATTILIAKGYNRVKTVRRASALMLMLACISCLSWWLYAPTVLSGSEHSRVLVRYVAFAIPLTFVGYLFRAVIIGARDIHGMAIDRWLTVLSRTGAVVVLALFGWLTTTTAAVCR